MIYTTGTVSTVSGSAIVRGTGTKFKNNNPAINIGMTILIKSGNTNIPYMIKSVNSDTELVLAQPALATTTNTTFSIHITEPDNNSDAARTMVAINAYTQYFLDAMNTWMTETGQTKIEMPNGEVITLDSIKKMQGDISKKADDNKTVHIGDFGVGAVNRLNAKNLNEVIIAGDYQQDATNEATLERNYPIKEAGALRVAQTVGGWALGGCIQEYTTYLSARKFIRVRVSVDWYPWEEMPNRHTSETQRFNGQLMSYNGIFSSDKNNPNDYFGFLKAIRGNQYGIYSNVSGVGGFTVKIPQKSGEMMLVGDHGVGGKAGYVTDSDLKDPLRGSYFFSQGANVGSNYFGSYGSGISLQYDNNISFKFFVAGNGITITECLNAGNQRRNVLWGSVNTTLDSNGFIKRASPIIDINPDGTFNTNDESEGATVTRVAQGEYLIEGVLGFNADAGWGGIDGGIEIPLDVNKQPLIWVDSEVNKDGSILVKTYHRTHPNAPKFARNDIDGYNDGDPIDIPSDRFISVRVQMPEQSIYNVRMREMEEVQKVEEERRQKEEEMKEKFGLGKNDVLL
ncbi:hypothetical protein BHE86_16990 [Shigella sp. FC1655]|uniref:pyocin knob domain-containing protein n=1 Tax=Shigella sp. FC1967 TaxID=1898041 RepID=UPI00084810B4|nr:pyocin knob domain-containing protein [Shigella sp. FC1967]ODQ06386.1 hypothetical protein BGK50_18245 [Shigella sp. FC130]OEI93927.1 hypothetical protein BHE86_16990 [Shigella sp. FC1655]OEJ07037.1 hypothetical protein BHE89_05595 [Shigella sp. FC1967]